MSTRELFTFITSEEIKDEQVEEYLEKMSEKAQQSSESIRSKMEMAQEEVDEAVFMQSFIPRALNEVRHFEEEHQKLMSGDTKDVYIGKAVKHEFLNCDGEERKFHLEYQNIYLHQRNLPFLPTLCPAVRAKLMTEERENIFHIATDKIFYLM